MMRNVTCIRATSKVHLMEPFGGDGARSRSGSWTTLGRWAHLQ